LRSLRRHGPRLCLADNGLSGGALARAVPQAAAAHGGRRR
jgi:hypothetical protein